MTVRCGRWGMLVVGVVLAIGWQASAATIGINFGAVVGGGGPSPGSSQIPGPTGSANGDGTGIAGAPSVAQGNWNDMWQGSGPNIGDRDNAAFSTTAGNLKYNTGAASGASVAWKSQGSSDPGGNDQFPTAGADGANFEMYQGYLDTDDNTTSYVTVNNLPAAFAGGYDLYVYFLGSVSGRGGTYGVGPVVPFPSNLNDPPPAVTFQPAKKFNAQATTFDSGLSAWVPSGPQANGTDLDPGAGVTRFQEDPGASTTDFGNYGVFRGLTATNFTLWASVFGDGTFGFGDRERAPISAIQIVPVPEPATVGMFAVAGMALLRHRRCRRAR